MAFGCWVTSGTKGMDGGQLPLFGSLYGLHAKVMTRAWSGYWVILLAWWSQPLACTYKIAMVGNGESTTRMFGVGLS